IALVLRGANSVTYSVAQVSKPAVSRISKSASALTKDGLPTGKSAIQQVWKPALRHRICARLHLVVHFVVGWSHGSRSPIRANHESIRPASRSIDIFTAKGVPERRRWQRRCLVAFISVVEWRRGSVAE